jgi:ribosomal protein S18 acetylase RimI-like enzyme
MDDTAFRPAMRADAAVLAELVNEAGEGIPLYLWDKMKEPGESAWDVGRRRAARDEGAFSWRNATIIEHDGAAAGCLIGYAVAAEPEPIPDDFPAMFRPLQELENLAPATWYVNVLAVLPAQRNKGLGARLLQRAEETARAEGLAGMSIIVSDANAGARRLYERSGYREAAIRPMVKEDWVNEGLHWVLLTKPL